MLHLLVKSTLILVATLTISIILLHLAFYGLVISGILWGVWLFLQKNKETDG